MARVLLLMPSGTYRARDFLEAARDLAVEVVVGSEEDHSLGGLMGSRSLHLPLADPEAAARAIVDHDEITPLDAVVAVDDQGTVAASAAAERLGLRHNPPGAARAARDKLVMRQTLARSEVPQPAFAVLEASAGAEEISDLAEQVGLPCIIKPTTLSASQGVIRADTASEALRVAEHVRRIATDAGVAEDAPLLLERFVPGPEVALEGLLHEGALQVLAVFDKPDPLEGPVFEETIYVTPSRLTDDDLAAVSDVTKAAVRAIGLREGPVHAELRVQGGRAALIEVAGRTIGGLCSRALSFATGRTLEQLVLASALGFPLGRIEREERASGVLMLPIPRAGTFVALEGTSKALAVPRITDVEVTVAPGRRILPVPEGNRYLGFVFARARSPEEAEQALRRAWAFLDVRMSD